jgi:large subunit ribosomal protein L25
MDQAIQATVVLELEGADAAPGVVEGGVLSQEARELAIEALPGDIPDAIVHDVSGLELNGTVTLAEVTAPRGVTLLDDPETVVATITPPTAEVLDDDIETETEVVGSEGADTPEAQAAAEGATADEAAQQASSDES